MIDLDSSSDNTTILNQLKQAIIDIILPTQPWAKRLQSFSGVTLLFFFLFFLFYLRFYKSGKTAYFRLANFFFFS